MGQQATDGGEVSSGTVTRHHKTLRVTPPLTSVLGSPAQNRVAVLEARWKFVLGSQAIVDIDHDMSGPIRKRPAHVLHRSRTSSHPTTPMIIEKHG